MPLYEWECSECERRETGFRHVEARHDAPDCHGRAMRLVICPTHVAPDLPGYESPATGRWIEGRAARRDDLARSGCRPYEGFDQESKEAARRQRAIEAKVDRKLEADARRAFHELSPRKRRALEGGE